MSGVSSGGRVVLGKEGSDEPGGFVQCDSSKKCPPSSRWISASGRSSAKACALPGRLTGTPTYWVEYPIIWESGH